MRFTALDFTSSWTPHKMIENENCRSFPCYDMLSRCFHYGGLRFLFPVCFFCLLWLSRSADNLRLTIQKASLLRRNPRNYVSNMLYPSLTARNPQACRKSALRVSRVFPLSSIACLCVRWRLSNYRHSKRIPDETGIHDSKRGKR